MAAGKARKVVLCKMASLRLLILEADFSLRGRSSGDDAFWCDLKHTESWLESGHFQALIFSLKFVTTGDTCFLHR